MRKGQKLGRLRNFSDRICNLCGDIYSPHASNQLYCFSCIRIRIHEYSKGYRKSHAEYLSRQKRQYYLDNKEKVHARQNKWRQQNRYKSRQQWIIYFSNLKQRAYGVISDGRPLQCIFFGEYKCCGGQADWRILQLDHINGDGAEHKRNLKSQIYKWIVENPEEARSKLQIACANAQWIKRYENKEFPSKYDKPEESVEVNEPAGKP